MHFVVEEEAKALAEVVALERCHQLAYSAQVLLHNVPRVEHLLEMAQFMKSMRDIGGAPAVALEKLL
eukprot:4193548-Pleurochrysis_carterae.AAC.1